MSNLKNPALFYGSVVAAIVAIALCVYYLIPGAWHLLITTGDPNASHRLYALAFGIVALLCIGSAVINRPGDV